ncbi:response regulator [Flaviaesturariibacter terrae]
MSSPIRVLHIEDDPDYRQLLRVCFLVKSHLVRFEEADDCAKALWRLQMCLPDQYPQLIVLDLNMPGMKGYEFIEQFRTLPMGHRVPIVVFTSSSNPEDQAFCRGHGIDMLTKPHSIQELENMADWMIRERAVS